MSCTLFPYHYGSYATDVDKSREKVLAMAFPYHYGSYATFSEWCYIDEDLAFPYHYGSYATGRLGSFRVFRDHMFPYHYGSYATINEDNTIYELLRFHTTMVLTQPMVSLKTEYQ